MFLGLPLGFWASRISLALLARALSILRLAVVVHHAEGFGEHGGADAVLVHVGVAVVAGEQAVVLLLGEDEVDGLVHHLAVGALAGDVAAGEEGHDGQRGDGGADAVAGGPGAVRFLVLGQPLQRLIDGGLDLGRHRFVVVTRPRGGGGGEGAEDSAARAAGEAEEQGNAHCCGSCAAPAGMRAGADNASGERCARNLTAALKFMVTAPGVSGRNPYGVTRRDGKGHTGPKRPCWCGRRRRPPAPGPLPLGQTPWSFWAASKPSRSLG